MKKLFIILSIISILAMSTSCKSKVECDFCGEQRYCEERDLFGDTIHVCEDCLNELEEAFADE